jgi:carbonic anhydrase
MDINKVFKNNELWIAEKLEKDKNYFADLSKGQNPDILYIGCSDSRVTAEELMGVQPYPSDQPRIVKKGFLFRSVFFPV